MIDSAAEIFPPVAPEHELDAPPWLRVESTMMVTARMIRVAYDQALAPLGLNLTSGSLLAYVAEHGPITQTALAERLGIGRAAVGTLIDRLQTRGLVERLADSDDRRVWLVTSTPAGSTTANGIAEIDKGVRATLRTGISREERQLLASLLLRLQANLAKAADLSSSHPNGEQT